MQQKIRQFYHNQSILIKGSFFAFVGGMIANFLTYLFQLLMGRLLSPSDYGVLISLRSLMVYVGLFAAALQTALIKKISELAGQKKWDEVARSFWITLKFLALVALVVVLFVSILALPLGEFLRVSDIGLIFVTAIVAGIGYLVIVPTGFLSGLWRFKSLAAVVTANAGMLLLSSVVAVEVGYGLVGVMWAHLLALIVAFSLGIFLLRENVRRPKMFLSRNNFIVEITKFTGPALLITVSLMAFYNTDILLVKHFFSAKQAGIYSGASIIGRIIFFGTSIITGVMFPIVSGKEASGGRYKLVFWSALGMVLIGSFGVGGVYLLFPAQVVSFLFGEAYAEAVQLLPSFAVFMGLYSVLNLFSSFFLAVKKFLIAPILAIGALSQAGAIWFWHESLTQVIGISTLTVGMLILGAIFLFFFQEDDVAYRE